jgi:hypothetical protein
MEHQHSYSKYELVNMASVRLKSPLRLTPDDMALSFELSCAVALSLLIGRMPGEWLKRKDRPCARLPPLSVRGPPGLCRAQHRTRFVCLGAPLATCTLPVGMFHLLTYSGLCPRPPFRRTRPGTGARAPGAPLSAPVRARADRETPQEASLIYIIESSRAFPPSGDPARCAYGKGRT